MTKLSGPMLAISLFCQFSGGQSEAIQLFTPCRPQIYDTIFEAAAARSHAGDATFKFHIIKY